MQFTYDIQSIQNNVIANAIKWANQDRSANDNLSAVSIADNIGDYSTATLQDLTCLVNTTDNLNSRFKKARYSIRDRIALYSNAVNNSLSTYIQLLDKVKDSIKSDNDTQLVLASFNNTIQFVQTPQKIEFSYVVRADGENFVIKDGDDARQFGGFNGGLAISEFLKEYIERIKTYEITLPVGHRRFYYINNTAGVDNYAVKNAIFSLEANIVSYFDFDMMLVRHISSNKIIYDSIACIYDIVMQLYCFYLELMKVCPISIKAEYHISQIGTLERILTSNNVNTKVELESPNSKWPQALLTQMINQSEYTITFTPYSVTHFPIQQLNLNILNGNIDKAATSQYTITNLFNVAYGNFANTSRNFENSSDGSNGVFSYFINVEDNRKVQTFSEFQQMFLQYIKQGDIISLPSILIAIDQIFDYWLNNMQSISIKIQLCHQNCHTNVMTTSVATLVCTCRGWESNTVQTDVTSKIPQSKVTDTGDGDSSEDD